MKQFRNGLVLVLVLVLTLAVFPVGALAKDDLKNTDPEKYYLVLDLKNQIVTVYLKNETGEYTDADIVRRFLCSSGSNKPKTADPLDIGSPTPTGIWKIGGRQRFGRFASFSDRARYWVQIVGDNLFHSVMYQKDDFSTLQSSAYGNLGSAVSHGCVRLHVEDAKWLYYYACPGTTIKVSDKEKNAGDVRGSLKKNQIKFAAYRELQKNFYDIEEQENDKCWVSVEGARIRKGNGKTQNLVTSPGMGAELEILFRSPAWYCVRYDKRVGYILRGYITETQGTRDTVEDATMVKFTDWLYTVKDQKVANRICKVPSDTSVKVLEVDGAWTKVQFMDQFGFINEIGYMRSDDLYTGWGLSFADVPNATDAPDTVTPDVSAAPEVSDE